MPSDSPSGSVTPGVRMRVLGSVSLEVVRVGDVPAVLGPRLRRLLAILTTRAGSVVSVDAVADALWGDEQPTAPDAALHTLVSRLRVALRATVTEAEESAPTVLTRAPGYLLSIEPTELDASRFEQLARAGRSDLGNDPARAAASLSEALELWRGPAYAEFAHEDFARTEAIRLDGLHDTTVEDYADALLALGLHDDAVPLLERLIAREPLRERGLGQLIRARYRRGQQVEALSAFQDYRERLADELGLDPSPGLRQLQQDVLRQDPGLDASPVPRQRDGRAAYLVSTPPANGSPAPGNLPEVPPVLIGREPDLAALVDATQPGSVVTLTGPGGVGKTSLALRLGSDAGHRFPDGVWFCDLSSLTSEDDLALAVMSSLDLQVTSGTDQTSNLLAYLRTRRLLLILDSCEHVLGAAAALSHEAHRQCPEVMIVATSRAPLEVADERVWPVAPLPVPPRGSSEDLETVAAAPAVQLFVDRARRRVESFELGDGNAEAVAEICRRLDGLPLAIELAAARMGAITPADLVDRLSWRFRLLHGGVRSGAERHRTLRDLVDWSFDLLEEDQKRVFEVLSVFAGSFDLDDAERLVLAVPELESSSDEAQVADIVLGLVDRSMVAVSRDGHRTSYSMLETLRAYGRQQLETRPYVLAAHLAHARMIVDLTTDAASRLYGPGHVEASTSISGYLDELRVAHAWALTNDLELAARLVGSLMLYVEHRMPVEVRQWAERTLRAAEAGDSPPGLAGVYAVAAAGARFTGDLHHAVELAEQGLQLPGEPMTTGFLRMVLGEIALFEGRLADAEQHRAEVAALATTSDLGAVLLLTELLEPLVAAYRGDEAGASRIAEDIEAERAAELLDGALELARAQGDRYASGVAMVSAGDWTHQWTALRGVVDVLLRLGHHEDAAVLRGGLVDRAHAAPIFGPDAERIGAAETLLRQRLGDDLFVELSQRGARMADDDVVSFARTALFPAN